MKRMILVFLLIWTSTLPAEPRKPPAADAAAPVLSTSETERLQELSDRIIRRAQLRSELPDGYRYLLDGEAAKLPDVAEWIALERRNCPFLDITLRITAGDDALLELRGPEGTKDLLQMELPALAPRFI